MKFTKLFKAINASDEAQNRGLVEEWSIWGFHNERSVCHH
jgi:hypothetical protein